MHQKNCIIAAIFTFWLFFARKNCTFAALFIYKVFISLSDAGLPRSRSKAISQTVAVHSGNGGNEKALEVRKQAHGGGGAPE
jgi:hypothetical protein